MLFAGLLLGVGYELGDGVSVCFLDKRGYFGFRSFVFVIVFAVAASFLSAV
jgi:hypothetical protein